MRLNYRRTVLVGFAFFLICAFWQIYDVSIAMTLTNKFGMSQDHSGIVMALDNILALFMLPLFGGLSDRCKNPRGRRTPFIVVGTILAVILMLGLSVVDNFQLNNIEKYSRVDDPATMAIIYDEQADTVLKTPGGKSFTLEETFTREEFAQITTEDADYTTYVVPARQACAAAVTAQNPTTLYIYIGVLLLLLIAMASFRTPAVALMPDVTVKPLRSKANAIINLMGTVGGIIVLALGSILAISKVKNAYMSYTAIYALVAMLMLGALAVFMLTVKEPKWARQMQEKSRELAISEEDEDEDQREKRKMTGGEKKSLLLILGSVVLWYFGYNAVVSKYAVYAQSVLDKDATMTLMIANAAAIVSYLPVGIISSKVGRKKTILAGVTMLFAAFFVAGFIRSTSPSWLMYVLFCLAGVGWATINVNSFPMAVELCKGSDVGKYTGLYYTASMGAQALTPYLSGLCMEKIAMVSLFPYAALFVGLAFLTMYFVKHGDNKPAAKKGLEALDIED